MVTLVDTATRGGGDVKTAAIAYLRTNLVPKISANVFFFALALLFLFIFALWRFLRWCCNVVCCSASCDARRSKNDPYELLFTGRMTAHKMLMFLAGLAAVVLYIYGMAGTSKTVVQDAFTTLDSLDTYLTGATGHLNDLVAAVGGINVIIDDLQAIVRNDIDPTGIKANITVATTFLTTASPAALAAALTALDPRINTDLTGALSTLSTRLAGVAPASMLVTALAAAAGAEAGAAAMTAALADVDAKIATMPAADGVTDPGTSQADVAAVATSILSAAPGMAGAWATSLDAISAAVTALDGLQTAANNPLTAVDAAVGAVATIVGQLMGSDIPTLSAEVATISGLWTTAQPALDGLVAQLQHINTTVLQLTAPMQTALDDVAGATTALASFFSTAPTPSSIASTLATTTAASLALPAGTAALRAGLVAQAAALDGAQFNATPALSDGDVIKSWVTAAKAAISASSGGEWGTMLAARSAYLATPNAANYQTFRNAAAAYSAAGATTAMRSKLGEQDSAPCAADDYASASAPIAGAAAAAYAAFPGFVTTAQAAVAGVPSLGGFASTVSGLTLPAATVFDAPVAALDAIEGAVVAGGDAVKGQVTSALATFSGAVGTLESQVLGQLDSIQGDIRPLALRVDTMRYQGSMVLYALPILMVLAIMLCALLANFHFGTNFAVLLLLILLVLGFLLGAVVAVVLAVLGDVCPAVEPVLMSKVPANMAPLASYYLEGVGGNSSVKEVLNAAGLVDVDAVLAQVIDGQGDVVADITADYTFRPGPTAVLLRINATVDDAIGAVDDLLAAASYDQVVPLYAGIKGLLCCSIPDSFSSMWTALTIGGMSAWFLVLLAFFFVGKLDRLPRTDCCGCTCHTRTKYAGTVAPGPMRQAGLGGWLGERGVSPAPHPAHPGPGGVSIPIPPHTGWEDGTVVAELVVRTPGSGPKPGKAGEPIPARAPVNVPKTKKAFCKGCKKHMTMKVTQYKTGKASLYAQGKRRYDRKQSGFGGQTKPVFHKKAKTTKKIRCKHFEIGGDKKTKGAY
ncbi:MAG: hypothetical protein J3K34DRAFT_525687 [Monoraphidium minutum]|nr:MAG: hypothetical protein J3K34DRAFT_525687 [Monoraphidium minutum]